MIRIYTGFELETIKNYCYKNNIIWDNILPEKELGPYEQIEWIEKCSNITFITMSPYILNALNALLAEEKIKAEDIEVWFIQKFDDGDLYKFDLICEDTENGWKLVNTTDFSDPIVEIYQRYNNSRHKNNQT